MAVGTQPPNLSRAGGKTKLGAKGARTLTCNRTRKMVEAAGIEPASSTQKPAYMLSAKSSVALIRTTSTHLSVTTAIALTQPGEARLFVFSSSGTHQQSLSD